MTAIPHDRAATYAAPTIAVCAGWLMLAIGAAFGAANLVQWGVYSHILPLHPAMLAISWPLAVGVFLYGLIRLRRSGADAARRVAGWSRIAILVQAGSALTLAIAAYSASDWSLMSWTAVTGLVVYGLAWAIAAARTGRSNMIAISSIALGGAAAVGLTLGTPDQNLIQALTLGLVALLPGAWLAMGRSL